MLPITTITEIMYIITLLISIKRTLKAMNKQPLMSYKNIIGNLLYKPTKPYLLYIVLTFSIPFVVYFMLYLFNSLVTLQVYKYNLFHVKQAKPMLITFTIISNV